MRSRSGTGSITTTLALAFLIVDTLAIASGVIVGAAWQSSQREEVTQSEDWRPDLSKCPDVKTWECIRHALYRRDK